MKTKWTSAQTAAIYDRGGALLVSAAAGSGKTAVLTERVVTMLQDAAHPVQADRLLIVTFTNAAAAELRARIAARLEQVLAQDPSNQHLRRQKMLLQRAHICTIDSFCLHLLQQHFTALEIPPDFALADVGAVGQLKHQALAQTLEQAYQTPAFCAFANLYGKGRSDDEASKAVLQLYNFLRTLPFPAQTKAQMLHLWQNQGAAGFALWHSYISNQAVQDFTNAAEAVEQALLLAQEAKVEAESAAYESKKTEAARAKAVAAAAERYQKVLNSLDEFAQVLEQVMQWVQDPTQWDTLYALLHSYAMGELPPLGIKGTRMRLSGVLGKAVTAQSNRASEIFAQWTERMPCTMAQYQQDCDTALPMIEAFLQAEEDFSTLFFQKKIEKKMLEFSDLEHLTLALLQEEQGQRTPLAKNIAAQFDAIMVDEYQDTNALQEAIYRRLANEAGDNLFYVGDIKQSIYRFRKADPTIFAEKQANFPLLPGQLARTAPPQGTAGTDALVMLDANFRSTPAVIDGVNFIFRQAVWGEETKIDYATQSLVCGAQSSIDGSVHLLLDPLGGNDPAQVAAKIAALMELGAKGHPDGMVRDGDALRAVRYEDCCILLTTRAPFVKYSEALAEYGIPTYADSAEDLLSVSHIQPLVALLKIIDNPAQDIPLAAAMLSVVFGFTEDDLVALRLASPKGSLYGAVAKGAAQARSAQKGADALGQKAMAFYETLSALRRLSHTLAPEELLAEIFATTHYLALVGAMENGTRRREDVSKFATYVASAGVNGIASLVHNIEQTIASGGLVDTAPGKVKPGCVTIMTVHRSKGLQFPVVFVANLEHRFNMEDLNKKILLHPNLGLGLQLRAGAEGSNYHTFASVALRMAEKQELRSEAMRLFYVALTRAQDHLYLSGSVKNLSKTLEEMQASVPDKIDTFAWKQGNSFMDWTLLAVLRHPAAQVLHTCIPSRPVACLSAQYPFAVQLLSDETQENSAATRQGGLTAAPDAALVQSLLEGFGWQYPHAGLTELPAKVSVTSLVHKEQATLLDRPAFLSKDGMTAAEKGTALHAFLENADFEALKQARVAGKAALQAALQHEQARQVADKRMLPELAEKLEMASVEAFFLGEAFHRIAEAAQIHREYAFITGVPAQEVLEATQGGQAVQAPPLQGEAARATVLVQGIADLVLLYPDHIELLDYKSDHGKNEAAYRTAYAKQLKYYATAIEKRFAPLKITYKALYSFDLDKLIEV